MSPESTWTSSVLVREVLLVVAFEIELIAIKLLSLITPLLYYPTTVNPPLELTKSIHLSIDSYILINASVS